MGGVPERAVPVWSVRLGRWWLRDLLLPSGSRVRSPYHLALVRGAGRRA